MQGLRLKSTKAVLLRCLQQVPKAIRELGHQGGVLGPRDVERAIGRDALR